MLSLIFGLYLYVNACKAIDGNFIQITTDKLFRTNTIAILNDLNGIFANISSPKLVLNQNNPLRNDVENYIIFTGFDYEDFDWNPRFRFLFVLHNENLLNETFYLLWKSSVYKVIVMLLQPELLFFIFDYTNYCNNYTYIQLDSMEDLSFDAIRFKDCNISIIWSPKEPFVMYPNDRGVFLDLIETISQKDDLRLNYEAENENFWLEVQNAGTYFSVLESFNNGTGDIYLAAITLQYDLSDLFDTSVGIWEDKFIWAIPKLKNNPNWQTVVFILTPYQWLGLIGIFFIIGCVFKLFAKHEPVLRSLRDCYLLTYCIFLGISFNNPINAYKVRLFYIICVWCMFIFVTYFQGRLYAVFSHPTEGPKLNNMDEIYNSDIPIIAETNLAISLVLAYDKYNGVFFRVTPSTDSMKDMLQLAIDKNYITGINEGLLISNPHMIQGYDLLDFYKYQTIIIMKKGYFLTERINTQITRLKEGGVIEKMISDIKWNKYVEGGGTLIKKQEQTFHNLSLSHVLGSFVALGIGNLIAILVFTSEILLKRLNH